METEEVKALVKKFIHAYLEVDEAGGNVLAEYAMQTWKRPKDEVKYLLIVGEPGCGKTRAGKIMQAICRKASFSMDYASVVSLLEIMDQEQEKHPITLILDDVRFGTEMARILNTGYRTGMRIGRLIGGDCKFFNPFGYKIILSTPKNIRKLGPPVLSKCLRVDLKQRTRDDIPVMLSDHFETVAAFLRTGLIALLYDGCTCTDPVHPGSESACPVHGFKAHWIDSSPPEKRCGGCGDFYPLSELKEILEDSTPVYLCESCNVDGGDGEKHAN